MRLTLVSLACVVTATVAATPAVAAPQLYRAGLSSPASVRLVVKDVPWACVGTSCAAPRTAASSDATVCAGVVRKLGPITSFSSGERNFGDAELAKCNAAAE